MSLDIFVFSFLHSLVEKLSFFNFFFAFLAIGIPYFLFLSFFFFVFRKTDYPTRFFRIFFTAVVILISRGIFTEIIRFFFPRERPYQLLHFEPLFETTGFSFPSGHAALLFALAFSVFFMDRKWGWWFFVFAILNGIMRVFSGVHWPSDIFGGFIIAGFAYFCVRWIVGKDFQKKMTTSKESSF